jgi:polysaccharide biosynthesis transport protein
MIAARAQLRDIDAKIEQELSNLLESLRSEVEITRARRDALQATLDKLHQDVTRNDHAQVQLLALEREAEASRAMLTSVLQRSKEVQAETGLQQAGVKLVSAALVPVDPSSPKVLLLLVLGGICAIVLAICAVFISEYINQSITTMSGGERLLGIPGLGWLPLAKEARKKGLHTIPLVTPFAPYSEAIRSLATKLWTRNKASGPILLVASAAPGEGKTSFALSYAQSLALARQTCLVIDADLRRPSIVRRLNGHAKYGLTDVIAGRASLWDAIERDDRTGLHYLGSGNCDQDPLEVFGSHVLEGLLQTAAARYQHIVLDVPPLLAVSDALLLARFCDAAVLVVKWNHTAARLTEKVVKQLRAAGLENISFVLSQVEVRRLSRLEDESYNAQYLNDYTKTGTNVIRLPGPQGGADGSSASVSR